MSILPVQTLETAPEAYGFIPNITATFANSPAMIEAYGVLARHFDKTDLSVTERLH